MRLFRCHLAVKRDLNVVSRDLAVPHRYEALCEQLGVDSAITAAQKYNRSGGHGTAIGTEKSTRAPSESEGHLGFT